MRGFTRFRASVLALLVAGVLLPAAALPAGAAPPTDGLPRYDHVFVLLEENESLSSTYGAASPATYLKGLAKQGVFEDHYYATGHNSLDNYVAMLSGQPDQPVTGGDCLGLNLYTCAQQQLLSPTTDKNLTDQYEAAGVSWRGYMDGTTAACQHADYSQAAGPDLWQGAGKTPAPAGPDYADRHNPFLYFPDIVGNDARCQAHVKPYSQLALDIAADNLPQFGFITPDTCHDGHDNPCSGQTIGGLVTADAWLKTNAPVLIAYLAAHNGLLLIVTDESAVTDTSGCCTGGPGGVVAGVGGLVGMVGIGPGVKAGRVVSTPYDHMSLLRFLEGEFGITEHLNNASGAAPLSDLFAASTAAATPTASAAASPVSAGAGGLPGTSRAPGPKGLGWTGLALAIGVALAGGAFGAGRSLFKHRRSR